MHMDPMGFDDAKCVCNSPKLEVNPNKKKKWHQSPNPTVDGRNPAPPDL